MKNLFRQRIVRFIIAGSVATLFNLLLIVFMIDALRFNTPFLRNIANVVSIELSLLFSFFVYRTFVWSEGTWKVREVLSRQLPLYHISTGAAVILRILILFPILDWLGINYAINTLLGVLLSSCINYVMNERLVFRTQAKYRGQ